MEIPKQLRQDVRSGGVTLVLGAGVSKSWGAPLWSELVAALAAEAGVDGPVDGGLFEVWLEHIAGKLGRRFPEALRKTVYRTARPIDVRSIRTGTETLPVLARLLARELSGDTEARVRRVVNFNVDDLLNRAVNALVGAARARAGQPPALKVIPRASHHPMNGGRERSLSVYHPHGYLPSKKSRWHEDAPDTLVFTDQQYWQTTRSPLSFANRVMASALHDSHCIFIGLSMTDVNLRRWLALRADELEADKRSLFEQRPEPDPKALQRSIRDALERHWWVRTGAPAPLASLLEQRGVRSVVLPSWAELGTLIDALFGGEHLA